MCVCGGGWGGGERGQFVVLQYDQHKFWGEGSMKYVKLSS